MVRVAIVEDSLKSAQQLKSMIERYGEENGRAFQFRLFANGVDFISDYSPQYDLVLMDIDLPLLNGLETSKILRKLDGDVALVFVTNLEKYAISGYDVGAIGFIVKPLNYATLSVKMHRFLSTLREETEPYLVVASKSGVLKLNLSDIYYITVSGRYVVLHTKSGDVELHKSMKLLEKELSPHDFVRCDNSSMVNLKHVSMVDSAGALVNGNVVPCSRNGRKVLLDAFTMYLR